MPGGLLTLVSTGPENVILNSNPKKTFFKATYAKHTNFGLQKFRLNYEKEKTIDFLHETELTFKLPRYGDLIHDTFICVNLPNIYSPLYFNTTSNTYFPYEFKWIENLGTTMIKEIQIIAGGLTLAKYSGEYLHCLAHRDLTKTKKEIFDKMIGHVPEMYDPANGIGLNNTYPSSYIDGSITTENAEPSIRQRKIYIPLYSWFTNDSKLALPLIGLQYQEVFIKITFRPFKELYTILDVENSTPNSSTRIAPNPNNPLHTIRRFLRKPKRSEVASNPVITMPDDWVTDVHLMATYIFLDEKERQMFASKPRSYLIKQVITHDFLQETGSRRLNINSAHCVSNYMFRFRRSDVNKRNQWTNFTNWSFDGVKPQKLENNKSDGTYNYGNNIYLTGEVGNYAVNLKDILIDMGIVINGDYRENILDNGVYLYCEKFTRTKGTFKDGLYHYSFALDTNLNSYQPSGSMNLSKYDGITFEYNTLNPAPNTSASADFICGPNGELIGIRKDANELNEYNYDFRVYEERYNVLTIANGTITLMFAN